MVTGGHAGTADAEFCAVPERVQQVWKQWAGAELPANQPGGIKPRGAAIAIEEGMNLQQPDQRHQRDQRGRPRQAGHDQDAVDQNGEPGRRRANVRCDGRVRCTYPARRFAKASRMLTDNQRIKLNQLTPLDFA